MVCAWKVCSGEVRLRIVDMYHGPVRRSATETSCSHFRLKLINENRKSTVLHVLICITITVCITLWCW